MTLLEAIPARHSVRAYTGRSIPPEAAEQLRAELQAGNQAGGLHMQLVTDDPAAFDGLLAHYGKFRGVRHYIALIGPKTPDLEEKLGYYGERAALLAQTLGLNTCWVALTFRKGSVRSRCQIGPGKSWSVCWPWAMERPRACPTRARTRRRSAPGRVPVRTGLPGGWRPPCWLPRP